MIIETSSYFSLEGYQPDLECLLTRERIEAFVGDYRGMQVLVWVKTNFGKYIHDEVDTAHATQVIGILAESYGDSLLLDPWFRHSDIAKLGRMLLRKGGLTN